MQRDVITNSRRLENGAVNGQVMLPEGYRLGILRYHKGNDPTGSRRQAWCEAWETACAKHEQRFRRTVWNARKRYVTVAFILNGSNELVEFGVSRASPRDTAQRELGRTIATGRAIARFQGRGSAPFVRTWIDDTCRKLVEPADALAP